MTGGSGTPSEVITREGFANSMTLRVTRFANLFLVGLLAGLLVGVFIVELALLDLPASVYTAVEKPKHEVFEPIMPVFVTLVDVSGVLLLFLMRRELRTPAFALTLVAVVCTLALTVTTLLVNVPINAEIMDVWPVENPPANWAEVRDRWNFYHNLRTVLAVVAFVCLLLAALELAPSRKEEA